MSDLSPRPCGGCGFSAANGEFCEDEFLEPCPCGEAPWVAGGPAPEMPEETE